MYKTMLGPFSRLVPNGRYLRCIRQIDKFVMPFITAALALPAAELEEKGTDDRSFTFLHSIARYTRDPRVLRDQIVAVLLADRDTTAATLSWAFYELSHEPDKYARLRRQVLAAVGRDRAPTYADLKDLAYLRYVLSETLRLYPAVPYNLRTALEDTTLPGPEVFAPERWEVWSPKPWNYVPFNGGPRICVGQNFALTEMVYVSKCLRSLCSQCLTRDY